MNHLTPFTVQCGVRRGLHRPHPRMACGVRRGASMNRPPTRSPTLPRKACGVRRGASDAVCRASVTPGKSAAAFRKAAERVRKPPALIDHRNFAECQLRDLTCVAAEIVSFSMNHDLPRLRDAPCSDRDL